MKTLRQTCAVTAISVVLSVSAFGGQISSPGVVEPPPPPPETATSTSTSTDITTTLIMAIVSLLS